MLRRGPGSRAGRRDRRRRCCDLCHRNEVGSHVLKTTMIRAAAALAAGVRLASTASAGPGDDPCEFAVNYFCRFIPIAPDLENDVALTQQLPPADPNAPPPESLPIVDPCTMGCI